MFSSCHIENWTSSRYAQVTSTLMPTILCRCQYEQWTCFSIFSKPYKDTEGLTLTFKKFLFTIASDVFGAIEGSFSKMTTFICDFLPICLSHHKTNSPLSVCILFFFKVSPPYLQRTHIGMMIFLGKINTTFYVIYIFAINSLKHTRKQTATLSAEFLKTKC